MLLRDPPQLGFWADAEQESAPSVDVATGTTWHPGTCTHAGNSLHLVQLPTLTFHTRASCAWTSPGPFPSPSVQRLLTPSCWPLTLHPALEHASTSGEADFTPPGCPFSCPKSRKEGQAATSLEKTASFPALSGPPRNRGPPSLLSLTPGPFPFREQRIQSGFL